MPKSKIRSRPPRLGDDRNDAADAFIDAAEQPPEGRKREGERASTPAPEPAREPLPWEDPKVRDDVKKLFSLRLPEPVMLKLQYISAETGKSMHQYVLEHLVPAIEEDAESIAGER